jgi:hypothetical protein
MQDLKRRIIAEFSAQNKAKGDLASFRGDMDRTAKSMSRMAKGALAFVGLTGGLYAVRRGLESVVKASMVQEDAERALMAATGGQIGQFKLYAAEMQRQTIYGDEVILQQMAYGINLGITTGKLQEATKAAIGLAAKYRLDLASAMMLVGRASQGQTQMLTRYGIVLDDSLTDQEKFNQLLEIGAANFHLAQAAARTTAGSLFQMRNAWGDVAEIIGDVALPAVTGYSRTTTKVLTENQAFLKRYFKLVQEGFDMIVEHQRKLISLPGIVYDVVTPTVPPVPEIQWPTTRREEGDALIKAAKHTQLILERRMQDEAKAVAKAAGEQTAAMQEHYDKITAMGGTYQEMQERMARERVETEIAAVTQQMEIEREQKDKALKDEEERLETMAEGFGAAGKRIKAEMRSWGERSYAFSLAFRDNIAWGLEETMRNFETWKEHLLRMFEEIFYAAVRIAFIDPLAGAAASGMSAAAQALLGGLSGTGGGGLGSDPGGTRSPHGGRQMPKLQRGGEILKTGFAIVHQGEKYSGVANPANTGSLQINITNESREKLQVSHAEQYMVSDKRIIEVTTKALQTDMRFRNNVKQANRS